MPTAKDGKAQDPDKSYCSVCGKHAWWLPFRCDVTIICRSCSDTRPEAKDGRAQSTAMVDVDSYDPGPIVPADIC